MDDAQQPPDPADVPVPLGGGVGDDAGRLLTFARDRHRAEVVAQRDVFLAAAQWAALHSQDSITTDDWVRGGDTARPIAGAGCPLIAEFCVAEFAAVIGRSTDSGRRLLGQAVEVRHRLPHLWARVVTGRLPAWKAAQIADATMPLSPNAAAFVDAQVACFAAKIGDAQLGRLIGEAIARFDPDTAEEVRQAAADGRHATLRFGQTGGLGMAGTEGVVQLDGCLDYADARDLEAALQAEAAQLAACGSTESSDVRRSQALGVLARRDPTLDLTHDDTPGEAPATTPPAPRRQVVIHAHLAASAISGGSAGCDLARIPGHGWVTADQVRSWCDTSGQVIVKPVIDTTGCVSVDAYEIPDRLRAQVTETNPTCVFPWCTRHAESCDIDHVQAHACGGVTCSCNLAPLCRRHHRLKTHTGWTYDTYDTASYLWTSPHGHRLRVTPSGTTLITRTCGCQSPTPPAQAPSAET